MSTLVSDIINACGTRASDPGFARTSRPNWLQFFNESQLEIASELKVLEKDVPIDLVANQIEYPYPADCVVLRGIRYSDTPSDNLSFRWLNVRYEDEFRRETTVRYPSGAIHSYCPKMTGYEIIGMPTVTVTGGTILTYVYVPQFSVSEGGSMALPDFLRGIVEDRMLIYGKRTRNNYAEALQDEKVWEKKLSELRDKIEDRNMDRRPAIRPYGLHYPYAGMN
jgi:hypothetical protein